MAYLLCQECINEYGGEHGKEKKTVLDKMLTFKVKHVEGRIGKIKNVTVVVFRGSDGNADWLDNFKFNKMFADWKWFGKPCSVHKGFFKQFLSIRSLVFEQIKNADKIIFCGHSLGGAIATLFSAYCSRRLGIDVGCITFGSPRVGDAKFKKIFDKLVPNSHRYVYGEDSVCKVPPSARFFYSHVKSKIRLGETSWREYLLFIPRKIFGNPLDHKPERYLKALGK